MLGHDTRAFLSVVRSLGRAGIQVHVAWFEDGAPALRSRYITSAHPLPAYRLGGQEWKDALIQLMRRERFDLVIPCDDQRTLPLADHRSEIERWGRVYLPSPAALDVLGDKFKTAELARSLGIPVPREEVVSSMQEAVALEDRFSPPLVIKPPTSYTLDDVENKRMVRRAATWKQAEQLLAEVLVDGPVAVQEFRRGTGIGVELLLHEGEPLLCFQHERLHEPLEGGGSSYRRSVPVSQELLAASLKLLEKFRYTGVAMVEFKREPETGSWVLLEVNARFWGSLPLALAAGADFPRALFELLVEGRTRLAGTHRAGICCRNLRADLKWHYTNLRGDRSDPTLNSKPWPEVARETIGSLVRLRERSDTFTLDDPGPGFAEIRQMAGELITELRTLARYARARTGRRRRLRAAARADLAGAHRILFVCRGNIARSPFAAALAERWLPDGYEVRSAGFLPAGRPSPAAAIAAAGGWDVDLKAHRSRTVSADLVQRSDAIFVFDYRNYRNLLSQFPEARSRLHFVGALAADAPLLIPDPLPRGESAFVPAYRHVAEALSVGLGRRP